MALDNKLLPHISLEKGIKWLLKNLKSLRLSREKDYSQAENVQEHCQSSQERMSGQSPSKDGLCDARRRKKQNKQQETADPRYSSRMSNVEIHDSNNEKKTEQVWKRIGKITGDATGQ